VCHQCKVFTYLLKPKLFETKAVEENEAHILCPIYFFFKPYSFWDLKHTLYTDFQAFMLNNQPFFPHTEEKASSVFVMYRSQIVLFLEYTAVLQYGFEADIK
jgi:hypothetical protein